MKEKIKRYWLRVLLFIFVWWIFKSITGFWLASIVSTIFVFLVAKSFWERGEFPQLDDKILKWFKK